MLKLLCAEILDSRERVFAVHGGRSDSLKSVVLDTRRGITDEDTLSHALSLTSFRFISDSTVPQNRPSPKAKQQSHSERQVPLQVHPNRNINMLACKHAGDSEAGV